MRTARLPGSLELLFTDEPVLDLYAQTPWRVPDGLIDELAARIDGLIADPRSARLTVERHSVLRTPTPAVVADVLGITAFLLGDGAIRAGRRCRLDLDLVERFRTPASVHFRRPTWAAPASPWRPADGELFRCAGEDRALRELAWELTEEILRALEGIAPVDERREGLLGLFELVGEDGGMMETVLTTPRGAPEWLRVEELWTDAASDEIVQVLPELTGPVGYLGWIVDGWLGAQERLADAVAGAGDAKTLLAELLLQAGTTEVPAELAVGARGDLYGELEERLPALAATFHVAEWRQRVRAYLSRALVLGQVELARAFLDLSVRFTAAVQGAPGKPVTPDPCLVPVTEFQADLRRLFRVRQVRHPLSGVGSAVPAAVRTSRVTARAHVDLADVGPVDPPVESVVVEPVGEEIGEPELSGAGLAEVNLGEPADVDVEVDVEAEAEAQVEADVAEVEADVDEMVAETEVDAEPVPVAEQAEAVVDEPAGDVAVEAEAPELPVIGEGPVAVTPEPAPLPEPEPEPEPVLEAEPEPAPAERNGVHDPAANGTLPGEPSRLSVSDLPRPAHRPGQPRQQPAAESAASEAGGFLAQSYRMIDGIIGQPALAAALREIASSPDQPVRLLVAGPPGTGRGLTVEILARLLSIRGYHGAPLWIGYEDFARLGTATAVAELRDRLAAARGAQLVVMDGLDRLVNHGLNGKALAEELNRLISGFGSSLQIVGFAAIDGYRRLVDADAALAAWWRVVRTRDFDGADFSMLFSRVVERRGLGVTEDAARTAGDLLASTPGEGQLRNARLATYLADLAVDAAKRRVGNNAPASVEVADLPPLQPEEEPPHPGGNGVGRNGNHVTVPRMQRPEHDPLAGLGRLS